MPQISPVPAEIQENDIDAWTALVDRSSVRNVSSQAMPFFPSTILKFGRMAAFSPPHSGSLDRCFI